MPDLLILLCVLCAFLLMCNGAWMAFEHEIARNKTQSNYGVFKFILGIATLLYIFHISMENWVW